VLTVTDRINIDCSLDQVYSCFWRAELWPTITQHVKKIEMLDESTTYQRFRMQVLSNNKLFSMETERIGELNHRISYRQTTPPRIFDEHTGEWLFAQRGTETVVTVIHHVLINEEQARATFNVDTLSEAEQIIAATLKRNGSMTMMAVKELLERRKASVGVVHG
jgi:hypothetical protein